jgi:hypothetical protein
MIIQSGEHHLGDETDIFLRYQPFKKWQFTGAIGWFNPGDLEQINYEEPENALWMALQVLFNVN